MRLLAVGISYRTADVGLLERAAVPERRIGGVLKDLLGCDNLREAMLVSTCNRVEIYAVARSFRDGLTELVDTFPRHVGVDREALYEHLYLHSAAAAVEHLFRVTAGLDAMTVGETQVLGQIRTAYGVACQAEAIGSTLHTLVQQALRVGKRVRTEPDLDRAGHPPADAEAILEALSGAEAILGGLAGRTALVLGAGSLADLAVAALHRAQAGEILTEAGSPRAAPLARADVVAACTALDEGTVAAALSARQPGRPLVICDLATPAGAATLAGLPEVHVITGQQARVPVALDIPRAAAIVTEEVRAYLSAQRGAAVGPMVTALHQHAARVIDSELVRMQTRLPNLDPTAREELARAVRRVVDKLLHTPTVRIKEQPSYSEALRELFLLDPRPATG